MNRWLLVLLLPIVAGAQDLPAETVGKLDAAAEAARERKSIPGLTLAVGRGGAVRYARGFGHADLENDVKVGPDTRFRTASIAKSMTAVAVMQLVEKGKVDLDADVRTYCPSWPEKRWPVTCRQLLGHQGGVRHYTRPGEARGTRAFFTLESTLELFKDDDLVCEPGTAYRYTTYGYTLLGLAVEAGAGTHFTGYMGEKVWAPAGMRHSLADIHYLVIRDRARGYQKLGMQEWGQLPDFVKKTYKPGMIFRADLHDTTMKIPGGGFLSTSPDLVRFGLALLGDRLVTRRTRDLMWTRGKLRSGFVTSYGLGFNVGTFEGTPIIGHGGSQAGTSTYYAILPERGLVVAAMCNLTGIGVRDLVHEAMRIVLATR